MTSPAVPSGMTSSPLAELKIADSHFLGFCAQVTDLQEAPYLQAKLKESYSNAAHVPLITTFGDWDEDGEPPSSIGPGMLQELQEFVNENDKLQFRLAVVIVRFFGERLLGVTCGRLEQCYRSVLRLTLHRFFFPDTAMERELHIKNHDNIYAMGAGDCELILNVVQDDKVELVQTLLTELQFDGFKGATGEELPRLQNLQADLSQGVIPIYRYPGNYSGDEWMTYEWSTTSLQLKKAVEEKLQPLIHQTMNHCVTNYYRSGKDFIAHHGDKDLDLNRQGVIVSLSLGDERTLELRRRASPQDVYRVRLPHCSMLVLGPNTNREWTHSILPKDDSNETRLSLTLREVKTFQDLSTGRLFGQGVGDRTLTQVRATEQLEKLALLSGFCALSSMILSPSTTRALSRNKSLLMMGTLAVSQHLQAINDRFPHHDDFKKPADAPKEQVTPWWCAVRNSFLKRCKKFQAAYGDDVAFGIEPVVPLYKNNNLAIGLVILGDPFAAVDQKSVFLEKVQKATNRKGKSLEERCWLVFVGEALARGGEVRYLHYDNWTFHQFTHVLDTQWTEMKTVNTYAMPFVPDKTHWTSDIYHALGSWFLVEDGLHRNMEEIEGGMQNVVFPSLCKTGESSTAKLLTQAIQKCLPDNIKSQITSRSLRDAGITELAAHGSLSIYESCARSGHSTGTTQDHYISDQRYLYGLKAGMARAGYDVSSGDYTKKIHLPRVQAIGSGVDNQLHAFLDKCFTVDVPHFDKGANLGLCF